MSQPTRQEIIAAHEALDTLCARVPEETPAYAMKSLILSALPPRPQPTMAEIKWLDGVHYLAEAEHEDGRIVIMLTRDSSTRITFIWNELIDATHPQNLTPTGRLYTLTEVQ